MSGHVNSHPPPASPVRLSEPASKPQSPTNANPAPSNATRPPTRLTSSTASSGPHQTHHAGSTLAPTPFKSLIARLPAPTDPSTGYHASPRFICLFEGCPRSFARRSAALAHAQMHLAHRPFACEQEGCGQTFVRGHDLNRHQRRHTGSRGFACPACKKAFARADAVARHLARNICYGLVLRRGGGAS